MVIYSSQVPVLSGTEEYVTIRLIPSGTIRNRYFRLPMIERLDGIPVEKLPNLFNIQTSCRLLISLLGLQAPSLLERLHQQCIKDAAIVGELVEQPKERIIIQ